MEPRQVRFQPPDSRAAWTGRTAPGSGGGEGGFDQGGGQPRLPAARLGEVGLEAVAESQQFIDLRDDAVLFMADRKLWSVPF